MQIYCSVVRCRSLHFLLWAALYIARTTATAVIYYFSTVKGKRLGKGYVLRMLVCCSLFCFKIVSSGELSHELYHRHCHTNVTHSRDTFHAAYLRQRIVNHRPLLELRLQINLQALIHKLHYQNTIGAIAEVINTSSNCHAHNCTKLRLQQEPLQSMSNIS